MSDTIDEGVVTAHAAGDLTSSESVSKEAATVAVPHHAVAPSIATSGFVRLRNISKHFAARSGEVVPAVQVECLDIPLGGIIAIVGASGSGKTTLLNILGGLEAHDAPGGERSGVPDNDDTSTSVPSSAPVFDICLPGESAPRRLGSPDAKASHYPRRHTSYVFQQGYLLNQASIGLNLEITRRAAGLPVDVPTLEGLLRVARLGEGERGSTKTLKDRAVTLSGGQLQRLSIARALGREPTLLFADELSSSLDPQTAAEVLTAIRNWVRGADEHLSPDSGSLSGACNRESENEPTPPDRTAVARPTILDGKDALTGQARPNGLPFERTRLTRTMFWVTHDYPLACRFADALIVLAPGRPMPGLVRPIELHPLVGAVTSRDIESWLKKERLPEHFLQPTGRQLPEKADSPPPPAPSRDFGLSIANMLAGVRLSWMEAFRETPLRNRSGFRRLIRLPLNFAHRVRALQLAAVLGLVLIVTYGQQEAIGFFDAALDDPALRHVIVQQNVRELKRSVIDATSLTELSEEIEFGSVEPDKGVGDGDASGTAGVAPRWGFGRLTESVDVYPKDIDVIAQGFIADATIGIFEKHEPVYAELAVKALGDGSTGCNTIADASPGALIPYADELVLIASRRYVDTFAQKYGIDLCAEPSVDLWGAGKKKTFQVVGVVESLPADGYERFDLVMQADVWHNWASRVRNAGLASYSRAAIYFDRQNHSRVIDVLRDRAFAFDEEIVSKFERLLGTASRLRNTFMAITWLSLAVAITVAAGLVWSYLSQNAKAIALLRAHDASTAPLVAAIPFQLMLTFLYSLGVLALLALTWNALSASDVVVRAVNAMTDGAVSMEAIPWQSLAIATPPLAITFVVMLVVGFLSLCAWHFTHPDLAHELRETE